MRKHDLSTFFKDCCKGLLKRLSSGVIWLQSGFKSIIFFDNILIDSRWRSLAILVISAFLFSHCDAAADYGFSFRRMLVEYSENPVNIDESHPQFSWIIISGKRNQTQSSYRIMVSSSPMNLNRNCGELWDSGSVPSNETIHHEYGNNNLKSNTIYYWKVIIRDGSGLEHESPVSKFETALLSQNDWEASWIGNGKPSEIVPPQGFYKDRKEQFEGADSIVHEGNSLLLRREFGITKKVRSAKAFVTGVGFYEFFINGNRVGDNVLAPAKTPYHKQILYDTYDITNLLTKGANSFGIHLGNGWYNPYKKWWNDYRMQWFGSKKAIAQIHITFIDGTSQKIITDKNWSWAPGPVIFNCVYDGELFDANLDHDGWSKPGYDDSGWKPVTVFKNPTARLLSHRMPPIKVNECFKPRLVNTSKAGMKVYDMGQNFAGWVRIKVKGTKNTLVKIRFSEDLNDDGTINITSNENARATAEYRMKGVGIETYEPRFTYFGFKYVEITSQNGSPEIIDVEGRALYSANPPTGNFECDRKLVNKMHKATVWSQKSNMMGYPMDCPQRDERLGWFGDAQVTAEEAMFNFDMALFYQNWFEGIKDNQDEKTGDIPIISPRPYIFDEGIEWSSTYLTMLWQFYNFYGDRRILLRHYPTMKKYMVFLDHISKDLILPKGWIGDWGSMVKGWKEGEPASVPTAFYYLNSKIMAEVAHVLGNNGDHLYYTRLSEAIRDNYNKTYLNISTASYNDGSQMANSFPLYLGIVPENIKSKVLDNLVNDIVVKNNTHLTTGVLGTKYMPEALTRLGREDIAWEIINQKSAPGWNDMMSKYTTMCEFWTLKQSKNHVMMGSIDAWFYKYIAGIQLDENFPAFASFVVKPLVLDSLGSAKADIETIRGTISSAWKRMNGHFSLKVEVPFNTSAMVYIPGKEGDEIKEGGVPVVQAKGVDPLGFKEGASIFRVHSGRYSFTTCKNE